MTPEPKLRDLFGGDDAPNTLDVRTIIRRSRRRRLPRQIAGGAVTGLAAVGLLFAGIGGLGQLGGTATSSGSSVAGGAAQAPAPVAGSRDSAPNAAFLPCGSSSGPLSGQRSGVNLITTVESPASLPSGGRISVVVRLRNASSRSLTFTPKSTQIMLTQGSRLVWHATIQAAPPPVTLAPGQSTTDTVHFQPTVCPPVAEQGPSGPAVPSGDYELKAITTLATGSGTELVGGPSTSLTVR